jgi:hypothetical protein
MAYDYQEEARRRAAEDQARAEADRLRAVQERDRVEANRLRAVQERDRVEANRLRAAQEWDRVEANRLRAVQEWYETNHPSEDGNANLYIHAKNASENIYIANSIDEEEYMQRNIILAIESTEHYYKYQSWVRDRTGIEPKFNYKFIKCNLNFVPYKDLEIIWGDFLLRKSCFI